MARPCRRAFSRLETSMSNVPQPDQPEENEQPEPDDAEQDDGQTDGEATAADPG